MKARPAPPEPTLAAWSRTARPVRLRSAATHDNDDGDRVDDLLFGCSAAVLLAMPLILAAATLVG